MFSPWALLVLADHSQVGYLLTALLFQDPPVWRAVTWTLVRSGLCVDRVQRRGGAPRIIDTSHLWECPRMTKDPPSILQGQDVAGKLRGVPYNWDVLRSKLSSPNSWHLRGTDLVTKSVWPLPLTWTLMTYRVIVALKYFTPFYMIISYSIMQFIVLWG